MVSGRRNRCIAVWVILHCMSHYVCDFDESAIVFFMQGMQNPALYWLQSVFHSWNSAVADYVGRILQEIAIH